MKIASAKFKVSSVLCCATVVSFLACMTARATVLEVNVPVGTVQTNFTESQTAVLTTLTSADEIRKTGEGALRVTGSNNDPIAKFAGTIRISDGAYVLAADGSKTTTRGPLGVTGESHVIVESGATLYFDKYVATTAANYKNVNLEIGGSGYGNLGGALVVGGDWSNTGSYLASYLVGWRITLSSDAVFAKGRSNGTIESGCSLDMNGHALTVKNGLGLAGIAELTNPGTLIIEKGTVPELSWGGNSENRLIVQSGVSAFPFPLPGGCTWQLCVEGDRTIAVNQLQVSNPIEVSSGTTLTLKPSTANGLWLAGDLTGEGDIVIDDTNLDNYSPIYLEGARTRHTGSLTRKNERGQLVYLSKNAIPGWQTEGAVVGYAPNASTEEVKVDRFVYFAGKTAMRPDGWTSQELWTILECFRVAGNWGVGVYVDPGLDFTVDCNFASGDDHSAQPVTALGGGRLILRGTYAGSFKPYKIGPGVKNVVYAAADPTSKGQWGGVIAYGTGEVTFENCGIISLGSYVYWYARGAANRSDLVARMTIGSGTITESAVSGGKPLTTGSYAKGCRSVITLLDGGIISNGIAVAENGDERCANQCGSYLQRGGALRVVSGGTSGTAFSVGGAKDALGYAEIDAGEVSATADAWIGAQPTMVGDASFWLKGGVMSVNKLGFGGEDRCLFRQTGGSLSIAGTLYVPSSGASANDGSNGVARLVFEKGVRPSVPSGVVFCDRVNSTGSVDLVSDAVILTPSLKKATKISMWKKWAVGDAAAYVNFNGGGVGATEDGVELLGSGDESVDKAVVYSGGAILEAAEGVTATVSVPLEKPNGNGIKSVQLPTSELTGYTAAPVVRIAGNGCGATAVAEFDSMNEKVTGITVTSPGWGYSGTVVAELSVGGGQSSVPLEVSAGEDSGTGGLVKRGKGTIVLNAANSYSGETVVEDGTLRVAKEGALPESSELVLKGGTVEFARTGWIPSSLSVDPSVLSPEEKYVCVQSLEGNISQVPTVRGLPDDYVLHVRGNKLVIGQRRGLILVVR